LAISLLLGSAFPSRVDADILSTLFGSQASADTSVSVNFDESNSQNMDLLQANVSPSLLGNKDIGDEKIEEIKDLSTTSDNALLPLVATGETYSGIDTENVSSGEISVYVVRKGDSIALIAQMFNISSNTILWTNDMKKSDTIKEGDILIIMPVDGVKHTISKGDTLSKLADKYKVEVSDITNFNDISVDEQLAVGNEIFIPGAEIITPVAPKSSNGTYIAKTPNLKDVSGYFINPVPNYSRRSQGLHDKYAIDLAAPTGSRILASAPGKVLVARYGYNGGYGNFVIIQHSNGTQTLYAHMSKIATSAGVQVSRGETIGYVGSTGRSTGPHIHFEVRGAKNPGATTPMSFATK